MQAQGRDKGAGVNLDSLETGRQQTRRGHPRAVHHHGDVGTTRQLCRAVDGPAGRHTTVFHANHGDVGIGGEVGSADRLGRPVVGDDELNRAGVYPRLVRRRRERARGSSRAISKATMTTNRSVRLIIGPRRQVAGSDIRDRRRHGPLGLLVG